MPRLDILFVFDRSLALPRIGLMVIAASNLDAVLRTAVHKHLTQARSSDQIEKAALAAGRPTPALPAPPACAAASH